MVVAEKPHILEYMLFALLVKIRQLKNLFLSKMWCIIMSLRKKIGKLTSPLFVPLRRLIAWTDNKFGTCDHQLVLQPRPCFISFESEPVDKISELMKKVSKDKAHLQELDDSEE